MTLSTFKLRKKACVTGKVNHIFVGHLPLGKDGRVMNLMTVHHSSIRHLDNHFALLEMYQIQVLTWWLCYDVCKLVFVWQKFKTHCLKTCLPEVDKNNLVCCHPALHKILALAISTKMWRDKSLRWQKSSALCSSEHAYRWLLIKLKKRILCQMQEYAEIMGLESWGHMDHTTFKQNKPGS